MKQTDIYAGLLLAAGFGAVLWEASSFQYGAQFAPGPGFAPVWLGVIGIVLSLLIAINAWQAARKGEPLAEDEPVTWDHAGLLRVGVTLIGLVAMLGIAPWFGLMPAMLAFLLFLTLAIQRLSISAGVGASVGTVFFIYLVFVHFLDVPIPSGPLGF